MFKKLSLILIVVISLIIPLGTVAQAAVGSFGGNICWRCASICVESDLKKLSNVTKWPTTVTAKMKRPYVYWETTNHGGNSDQADGTVHLGDAVVTVTIPVEPELVEKNGNAVVTSRISDEAMDAVIIPALASVGIPVNHNWTLDYYFIESFTLRMELDKDLVTQHVIEYAVEWIEAKNDYQIVDTLCDSQDRDLPDCPSN
jgi:hypothetical protein